MCLAPINMPASSARATKSADERASFEKFVSGVMVAITVSCSRLKSSMLFCRSRMLRKKSRDISGVGRIVGGGFVGGVCAEDLDGRWYWDCELGLLMLS